MEEVLGLQGSGEVWVSWLGCGRPGFQIAYHAVACGIFEHVEENLAGLVLVCTGESFVAGGER